MSGMTAQENFKKNCLREAGLSYSISALLPVLLSLVLMLIISACGIGVEKGTAPDGTVLYHDWYLYLNFLLPQVAFAATAFIFFKRSKYSFKKTYCGCKWYYFLIALAVQFGLLFALNSLNGYFIQFLGLFGYKSSPVSVPYLGGWMVLPALLVIALLPALFEETLMRGILAKQMHENGWGTVSVVFLSGAFFMLFHHNPEQTLYQFACGVIYTLIALRSGSVFPTIVAHFTNNAVILILQSVYAPNGEEWGWLDIMPQGAYIALFVIACIVLIGAVVYLAAFDKRNAQKGKMQHAGIFFLFAGIGILVFIIEWVAALVVGFVSV